MSPNEVATPGEADDLLQRLEDMDSRLAEHWGSWAETARENYGMVAGDQWDTDAREMMLSTSRQPITFNRIEPTIDAVTGAEVTNRQEVNYQPRQTASSGIAELETNAAKWVRSQCDAEHEESESFRDMLICGMGWTETRRDQDEQPDSQIVIERVDPTHMRVDPSSRKRNCADARFVKREHVMSRREFDDRWPDDEPDGPDATGKRVTIVDPEQRYHNGELGDSRDEVRVGEFQWFEMEPAHVLVQGDDGGTLKVPPDVYAQHDPTGQMYNGQPQPKRRVYYRSFMAGGRILPVDPGSESATYGSQAEELTFGPDKRGSFTYKCMTGKRDRNQGTWYGLVRPMTDPQKFANKFFSQINHILAVNAKGGVMAERGAIDDVRKFEETMASSDQITYVGDGALSAGKITPKPATPYPGGIEKLMEFSVQSIQDTTGVNMEMLGMVDREQAGVLETQRKQAAYGLLSTYFDSNRLYRKDQGRLLLSMMQEFITPGTLIRLEGQDGLGQYVPFFTQPGVTAFDVIVDDAPAGPNQKAVTFQIMTQILQIIGPENMPPEFWPIFVTSSPLPMTIVQQLTQALQAKQNAPPSPEAQLDLQERQAKVGDVQSRTARNNAVAQKTTAETALLPMDKAVDHQVAIQNEAHENSRQVREQLAALANLAKAQQPQPGELE